MCQGVNLLWAKAVFFHDLSLDKAILLEAFEGGINGAGAGAEVSHRGSAENLSDVVSGNRF